MLRLARAVDDSTEAIDVPTRTIEARLTRLPTRPKLRAGNVSCRTSPRTLPCPRSRSRAGAASSTKFVYAHTAVVRSSRAERAKMRL
jgi:hypothetical protein